jgi:hypothetical protein
VLGAYRIRGEAFGEAKLPECSLPPLLVALRPAAAAGAGAGPGRLGAVFSGGGQPGRFLLYSPEAGALKIDQEMELSVGVAVAACDGDFDGDGSPDVAVLFGGRQGAVRVLRGTPAGKMTQQEMVDVGQLPTGMACGDVNADGRDDVVISTPESVAVHLSAGRGRFFKVSEQRLLGLAGPVALWPAAGAEPATVAALSLKGRAWVFQLPAPGGTAPAAAEPFSPAAPPPGEPAAPDGKAAGEEVGP